MGVLEAVRGWDSYSGAEPESAASQAGTDPLATEAEIIEAQSNSYVTDEDSPESEPKPEAEAAASEKPEEPEAPEDKWTTAELDKLARTDHIALLLEHARHVSEPKEESGAEKFRACYLFLYSHGAYSNSV